MDDYTKPIICSAYLPMLIWAWEGYKLEDFFFNSEGDIIGFKYSYPMRSLIKDRNGNPIENQTAKILFAQTSQQILKGYNIEIVPRDTECWSRDYAAEAVRLMMHNILRGNFMEFSG